MDIVGDSYQVHNRYVSFGELCIHISAGLSKVWARGKLNLWAP